MAARYVKAVEVYPGDIRYMRVKVAANDDELYIAVEVIKVYDHSVEVVALAGERVCIFLPNSNSEQLWERQTNPHHFRPIPENKG